MSRPQQVRLCATTLIIAPLAMAPLEIQRRIVNDAIDDPNIERLLTLALLYLVLILINIGLKFTHATYLSVVAEGVIRILRKRVTTTVAGESLDESAEGGGAKVAMASSEAEQLGGFVAESLSTPILHGGTLAAVLIYMMVIEPLIAVYTLSLLVPVVVVVPMVQKKVNRYVEKRIELVRELGDEMGENGDAAEETSASTYNDLIERIYDVRVRIILIKNLLKSMVRLLNNLGPLGVLVIGGWLVIQGETELGTVVAFISGYERLRSPAREILNFYRLQSRMRMQFRLLRDAVTT